MCVQVCTCVCKCASAGVGLSCRLSGSGLALHGLLALCLKWNCKQRMGKSVSLIEKMSPALVFQCFCCLTWMWDLGICLYRNWTFFFFFHFKFTFRETNVNCHWFTRNLKTMACCVRFFFTFPNHLSILPKLLAFLWMARRMRVKRRHYCCVQALGYHLSWSFPWGDENKTGNPAVNIDGCDL